MAQYFFTYPDGPHINTARSNTVRIDNAGDARQVARSSARSIQSRSITNFSRPRSCTTTGNGVEPSLQPSASTTDIAGTQTEPEMLLFSLVMAQSTAPDGEDDDGERPPPLPPRDPGRDMMTAAPGTRRMKLRQYSDLEYGTMFFLLLCCFLGALGLVIALVVGALDILVRLLGGVRSL